MEKDTRLLVERAQAGDEEAFSTLYRNYYQSVYIKANSLCRNEADAKDMTQDTFYEVHQSLINLRNPANFYSWLMMITVSKCHNMFRKKRHLSPFVNEASFEILQDERIYMNPHKKLDDEEEQEIIRNMVSELPSKYAEILQLVYFEHCKLIEAAEILDIPLGTVKTRIVRARESLKKKVLLFEKKEQRTLNFHEEALCGVGIYSLFGKVASKAASVSQFATTHAFLSLGICTFGVVATMGSAYIWDDVLQNQEDVMDVPSITQSQNTLYNESEGQNTFPSTSYKDQIIQNNRGAYYHCLNFAKNEEVMKQRTHEEVIEFLPIYETFKKENSPHYQSLQEQGWTDMFETYAYQKDQK